MHVSGRFLFLSKMYKMVANIIGFNEVFTKPYIHTILCEVTGHTRTTLFTVTPVQVNNCFIRVDLSSLY